MTEEEQNAKELEETKERTSAFNLFQAFAARPVSFGPEDLEKFIRATRLIVAVADRLLEAGQALPPPVGSLIGVLHAVVDLADLVLAAKEAAHVVPCMETCENCRYWWETEGGCVVDPPEVNGTGRPRAVLPARPACERWEAPAVGPT
jgi:hypothetical protein